ncbi:DUF3592 domain-containing protein [Candidatus Micrarchaeota archaeon]|nr:DUF3592 domain-containing protein [Candidatus Micrarchaeota archaeon]
MLSDFPADDFGTDMAEFTLIPTIMFGIFGLIGLLIVIFGVSLYLKKKRIGHWNIITGKVKESKLKVSKSNDSHDRRPMYCPIITYEYEVGGKKYEHTNSEFGSGNKSEVDNLLEKYKTGNEIEIRVKPDHPEESAIGELSSQPTLIIGILIAMGLVFVGAAVLGALIFGSVGSFVNGNATGPNTDNFDWIFRIIGPLFGIVVGAIFAWAGYYLLQKDRKIETQWKPTTGQIIESEVAERQEERRDSDSRRRWTQTVYSPVIRYKYSIDGKEYEGEDSGYGTSNPQEAQDIVATKEPGKSIEVFVNPQKPSESAIVGIADFQKNLFAYVFIGIGIVAMLIAVVIFVLG